MKSRFVGLVGAICGALLAGGATSTTHADTLSTSMVECQAVGASQSDLRHAENGVSTEGAVIGSRLVACSVARTPLPSGATGTTFLVTGDNRDAKAVTTCSLASYDFTGTFLGSSSFTSAFAHYQVALPLDAAKLGTWAYTSMTCLLPERNTAVLESVIAIQ